MSDLDDLLTGGVADAAAESVADAPELATLRARGERRRRARRTALAVVAAAGVAAVIAVAQVPLAGDRSDPAPAPAPSQTPTPTPTVTKAPVPRHFTADLIVDHPDARLVDYAVSPVDAEIQAAVWEWCPYRGCNLPRQALAVTEDGFRTRKTVRINSSVTIEPTGTSFVVEEVFPGELPRLLRPDGSLSEVTVADGAPAPLTDGEVAVGVAGSGVRWAMWLGIDPGSGAAHEFPVPDKVQQLHQAANGRLEVTTDGSPYGTGAFRWSDDGGASWQTHQLPKNSSSLYGFIPSARSSTIALVEGGDGATVFPFDAVHVSRDGGQTWERVSEDEQPAAFVATTAVLPDGRLLAHLESWADDRGRKPADRSHGFYVGSDWSDLEPVDMGSPFTADQAPHGPDVLAVHAGAEAVTIYAASEDERLFSTTDNGVTWEEVQTR